jgi:hypothetical protein
MGGTGQKADSNVILIALVEFCHVFFGDKSSARANTFSKLLPRSAAPGVGLRAIGHVS